MRLMYVYGGREEDEDEEEDEKMATVNSWRNTYQ